MRPRLDWFVVYCGNQVNSFKLKKMFKKKKFFFLFHLPVNKTSWVTIVVYSVVCSSCEVECEQASHLWGHGVSECTHHRWTIQKQGELTLQAIPDAQSRSRSSRLTTIESRSPLTYTCVSDDAGMIRSSILIVHAGSKVNLPETFYHLSHFL